MLKELLKRVLPRDMIMAGVDAPDLAATELLGANINAAPAPVVEKFVSGEEQTISYNDLTPERFKQLLQSYGCMLIKNLFDPIEIEAIRQDTLDLFYIIKNLTHNQLLPQSSVQHLAQGHSANLLPSLDTLEFVLNKSRFIECLQNYFGYSEMVVNAESTGIRRCDPAHWKNFLPWHQDVLQRGDQFFTCWMPLIPINSQTAGLDLVPKKINYKVQEQDGLAVANYKDGISDEAISAQVSELRWRPHLELGDVLLFDPYCVHRTSYHPDFCVERFSLDIRINPKNALPDATWKTQFIQLPSTRLKPAANTTNRSLFDLKHLIIFSQDGKPTAF